MSEPGPSPQERYDALVERMLARPGTSLSTKRGFGSSGLWTAGRLFAFLSHGRLVVKLAAGRVEELVARGDGERFDPGHGRRMREWLSLRPESTEDWDALAQEAQEFVGSGR